MMRNILFAGFAAGFSAAAVLAVSAPAMASSSDQQIDLCAAALDSEGVAPASDYRAKFIKTKGGAVKRVTLRMIPAADGAEMIEAECKIRGGEVVDVLVKS